MCNHRHLEGNHTKPLLIDTVSNKFSFIRFLPDLLNLHGNPCHTRQPQSSYRQPQSSYRQPQQYPSPGYVIPSPSTQYQQTVPSGYTVPNLHKQTISSGYSVPNLQKPSVTSGYNVPDLHKPSVSNGYKPTSVYQRPTQAPKNKY